MNADRWFFLLSVILTITIFAIAVSAIVFLSNSMLNAFVPRGADDARIKFDLAGYEKVKADLINR